MTLFYLFIYFCKQLRTSRNLSRWPSFFSLASAMSIVHFLSCPSSIFESFTVILYSRTSVAQTWRDSKDLFKPSVVWVKFWKWHGVEWHMEQCCPSRKLTFSSQKLNDFTIHHRFHITVFEYIWLWLFIIKLVYV